MGCSKEAWFVNGGIWSPCTLTERERYVLPGHEATFLSTRRRKTKQKQTVASLERIAEPKQISGNIVQSMWNQNFVTPLSVKLGKSTYPG